jgi:hypothetical protein
MPKGALKAAVDQLTKEVSTRVLGKRKLSEFKDCDSVALGNEVEFCCEIFDRLHQGKWFNSWLIMAAMQISDRPSFVRYGKSVPLDELGRNNRMKSIKRPLAGWAREIRDAKDVYGDAGALVRFRPLNHNDKHFSLLEFNEREKKIRHYDSMANKDVIEGTGKPTRVGRLVQVSIPLRTKRGMLLTPL